MTSARAALLVASSGHQQGGDRADRENGQHGQRHEVPADRHGRLVREAAVDRAALLQLRPAPAHHFGRGAGLGRQQVARTAHAVRDVRLADASGGLLALSPGEVPALPRTNHFGIRARSGDAVRAARERFAAAGVAEAEWQDDGTFVRVQILDPDGYRVDVYAT